ncbi:hypothetical protein B0H17DRAFT_849093, partial [Mycena rosella]
SYITMGRALRKVVSLFDPLEDLVSEYDRREELRVQREEDEDDTPVKHTLEQDRLYRGFQELLKFVPGLKLALVNTHPLELAEIYSQLRKGAASAHGDDTGSVRAAMVEWVPKGTKEPLIATSRVNRGIEGEVTGPLICPVDYDLADPEVRAKIADGDSAFKITADQWPRGVYFNSVYDPADEEKGLFKSSSLVQTFLHIFTSPQSAVKFEAEDASGEENVRPAGAGPPRKKRKHRFSLSDALQWNEQDGDFDYVLYYNNIVDWFEASPGPIAQKKVDELLAWWDRYVL